MLQKVTICGVDTSGLPKLSQKEQEQLIARMKAGDRLAREQFIVGNMRLVLSILRRFWHKNENSDDLFQAGCVGLIKAVEGFDDSYGVRFSTYAVPLIAGEVKRYLRDGSIRVSRSIRDMAYQVLKVRERLEEEEEIVTYEKIANEMQIAVSEVAYALDAISDPVSLYEPVYNNKSGDTLLLMDQIFDERNNDELWTENVTLYEAMKKLDGREKEIVYMRYFEGKTQTEISRKVGISQAQVSRLEKSALKQLRKEIS